MLTFKITNQTLELARNSDRVVADSVRYLQARFHFSSDWLGARKYALFYLPSWENPKQVTITDGACMVPEEVLVAPGFDVSVYGAEGTEKVITTEKLRIEVKASGLKEGSPPLPPPENLYETVQETVDEAKRVRQEISDLETETIANIGEKEDSAITNIKSVEAKALEDVASAGMSNSDTTFNSDGSITEVTPAYTCNTVFNPDGSITETFTYADESTKTKTTTFDGNEIHVRIT